MAKTKPRKPPKARLPVDDIVLIRQQAKKELEKARLEMVDELTEVAIVALAVAAFDEFDLTGDDLADFIRKFLLQFDCLAVGTVDIEELKKMLAEDAELIFECVR